MDREEAEVINPVFLGMILLYNGGYSRMWGHSGFPADAGPSSSSHAPTLELLVLESEPRPVEHLCWCPLCLPMGSPLQAQPHNSAVTES